MLSNSMYFHFCLPNFLYICLNSYLSFLYIFLISIFFYCSQWWPVTYFATLSSYLSLLNNFFVIYSKIFSFFHLHTFLSLVYINILLPDIRGVIDSFFWRHVKKLLTVVSQLYWHRILSPLLFLFLGFYQKNLTVFRNFVRKIL